MQGEEKRRLRARVREWFGAPEQVRHYRDEAAAGPTPAEAQLLDTLPAGGRVLDIGCGAGRLALELSGRGYSVVGVEVSSSLCAAAHALARARSASARFVVVEPLVLPFGSGSFDAALAVKVYGYIPARADRLAYLAEVARVLRPGAPLLLTSHVVPGAGEALDALASDTQPAAAAAEFGGLEPLDTFAAGRGYVHWFTAESLREELSAAGYTIEQAVDDGFQRLFRLRPGR